MKGNSSTGSPYMSSMEDVTEEDAEFKVPLEMAGESGVSGSLDCCSWGRGHCIALSQYCYHCYHVTLCII